MTLVTRIRSRPVALWIAAGCVAAIAVAAVFSVNDPPASASVMDQAFIAEFDGSEQKYVIMTPSGFTPDEPVSLLISLHGHGSDRWQFVQQKRGECQATRDVAASKKMLMVAPDYRATTSWMGPAAEADLLQIIRTLKQRYRIQRVILCGGSMGGTGALTFTALHPEMIDAVVSMNGTANLADYTHFLDAIATSFGGTKQEVPIEYRKRSAEFFPERFRMPFAATTGGKDDVVPADSVLRLIEEVRKHNSNVLSLHRPNGGHDTSYKNAKQALEFVITASAPRSKASARGE